MKSLLANKIIASIGKVLNIARWEYAYKKYREKYDVHESFRFNGNNALSLDQAPEQKGAMMSLHSAATNLGYSIGSGLGGLILIYSNWNMMGITLSAIGVCGSLVILTIKEK
jgi:MFS family permease